MDARRDHGTPQLFDAAAQAMLTMPWRPELKVDQIPAPQKIAPFAVAISAEITSNGEDLGTGRLVLLHDPDGSPSWDGDFRCVSFSRADVDPEMVTDPLLSEVGWSWLLEALERNQAAYRAPSGTVTAVSSKSFGGIAEDPARAEVEVRASWTPIINSVEDVNAHLVAWSELLCLAAGLPPLPEGVVPITPRRPGAWPR
ncbi:DUF3000 domain-containing protein [Propionicimonas sp.]|uniref:DUF3000 domain-containing protein n=1 Tax=Propionicimonas sp. TaxID=1955623 RepID=UPI0025EBB786|nr:DUF3000 domain-containing protein [Propionicimonas sp.]MCG2806291.1 DUF3000 domain-containing protein [Propionicimonas sp.]